MNLYEKLKGGMLRHSNTESKQFNSLMDDPDIDINDINLFELSQSVRLAAYAPNELIRTTYARCKAGLDSGQ